MTAVREGHDTHHQFFGGLAGADARLAAERLLLDLIYPPTCLLCGAPGVGQDLCLGCHSELPYHRLACSRCGLPFADEMPPGRLCGRCQRRPPPFAQCLTVFSYAGPVPFLVTGAKFHGHLEAARLLGQCLAERVSESGVELPEALVPVPLHPRRQRARGYNQAFEIGRVAARLLRLPIEPQLAARIIDTPPQTMLDGRARRRNVRRAFAVRGMAAGRHLAIVDDVMTTGSTLSELTKALLRSGARRVDAWVIARA
ncbi:ComF family protein [Caldichromatium japonicum]|uniref:ComF family protein n=2 Tax=Caldichromatium japonicum TaxID=2699430 RepID=A0A6G7VGI9_9GAMM|nr:ComF family protein [Caldichromatium japonicum]